MSYSIAKRGHLFVEFVEIIELEKLYGEDFFPISLYGNKTACRDFDFVAKENFNKEIKKKIRQCHFISIMCNSATDSAAIEK